MAPSDAVLRAQAGDPDAFESVYREYAPRVYALCLRMAGDAVRARELLQDVFVRVWDRLATFRGEAAFGTWLHRLAVNEVLMAFRAERRHWAEPLPEDDDAPPPPDAAGGDHDPAGRMDLEAAIAALPPGARQVLVLHDLEGYGHAEIAAMMGIAEGTSKAHLFKARRRLRKVLEP